MLFSSSTRVLLKSSSRATCEALRVSVNMALLSLSGVGMGARLAVRSYSAHAVPSVFDSHHDWDVSAADSSVT